MIHPVPSRLSVLRTLAAIVLAVVAAPSALTVTRMYPAHNATGQCLDTPLRLVFSGKPAMNWSGAVRIRNLGTNSVVHTWTLSSNPGDVTTTIMSSWPWQDSVGPTKRNVWPVVIDSVPEYLAEIRVPQHLLQPSTKYQVEVDGGVLKGADGSAFAGVAAGSWIFTTKARPASKSSVLVADDNSGDVCSIQGGLDLVPSGSASAVQVLVRAGYYRRDFAAQKKNNLQLYGEGSAKTVVRYLNSNNLNNAGSLYRNVAYLAGSSMSIRALSIVNTVDVAGAQAEALFLQGDKNVVADVLLHSFQDTWLSKDGASYVQDATLEGSVDFIWGYSPTFFKRSILVVNRTDGVVLQPRNVQGQHGFVFDSCTLKAWKSGYANVEFARDGGAGYAYGETMFLHTKIVSGSFLSAFPWTINSGTDASTLRFCEYLSRDENDQLLSIANTQRKSYQCNADSAAKHTSPAFVLGWSPSVPSLASVLAAFPQPTGAQRVHPTAAAVRLRALSDGAFEVEIAAPGPVAAREILPDGRTRALFQAIGPCRRAWIPTTAALSWIEIVGPQGRQVLAAPNPVR